MPRKDGRLTPQEQRFAALQAGGIELSEAAKRAGYTTLQGAYAAARRPAVAAEILAVQRRRLVEEGYETGLDTLLTIARDAKQPAGARVAAAKFLVERADPTWAAETTDKPLEQMTAGELEAMREKLIKRASVLAQEVEAEVLEHAPGSVLD